MTNNSINAKEKVGKEINKLQIHSERSLLRRASHQISEKFTFNKIELQKQIVSKLFLLFEKGEKNKFFILWNEILLLVYKLEHNLIGDKLTELEFRLRIYFATIPLRKIPPDKDGYKKTINNLCQFFKNNVNMDWVNSVDFVQFFALPYIKDPQKHPIFKEILEEKWVKILRADLHAQIDKIIFASENDFITANELLILLNKNFDEMKHKIKNNIILMKKGEINRIELESSLSNDENNHSERMKQIADQFINFLEQLCDEGKITTELLITISKRLKAAASIKQQSKHRIKIKKAPNYIIKHEDSSSDNTSSSPFILFNQTTQKSSQNNDNFATSRDEIFLNLVPKKNINSLLSAPQSKFFITEKKRKEKKTVKKIELMGNLISGDPQKARSLIVNNNNDQTVAEIDTSNKSKISFLTPTKIVPNFKSFNEQSKTNSINDLNKNRSYHSFENIVAETKKIKNSPNINLSVALPPQTPIMILVEALNFPKIINYLSVHPNTRGSALLMQAIRQQLTRTRSLILSDKNLQVLAANDILALRNRKNSIVAIIFSQTEPSAETKEELARLLNAISSFYSGRKYLLSFFQGKDFLCELALALRTNRITCAATDHTLAALQKLSIRSLVQKELILFGLIEWLIIYLDISGLNSAEILSNALNGNIVHTNISGNNVRSNFHNNQIKTIFGLEYALCLFTNILLNPISQTTILRYREQIVSVLSYLLKHKTQLTKYICNTLYCVIGMYARVRYAARQQDLETVLTDRISKAPNFETQCQLSVVFKLLRGELNFERKKRWSDDEELENENYLEAEIDSTDSVLPTLTDLFGESLLKHKFSYTNNVTNENSLKNNFDNNNNDTVTVSNFQKNVCLLQQQQLLTRQTARRKRQREQNLPVSQKNITNKFKNTTNINFRRQRAFTVNGPLNTVNLLNKKNSNNNILMSLKNQNQHQPIVQFGNFVEERTSSMMSHTTFVLENDQHKPLLVSSGFTEAVATFSNNKEYIQNLPKSTIAPNVTINIITNEKATNRLHQQQEKCLTPLPEPFSNNNNETIILPNEIKTQINKIVKPKMRIMSSMTSQQNKTVIAIQNEKKAFRRLTTPLQSTTTTTTTTKEKENNQINETEKSDKTELKNYMEVFVSRPKVVRTPERPSSSSNDFEKTTGEKK